MKKGVKMCRMALGSWYSETIQCHHPRGYDYWWMVGHYRNEEPEQQDTDRKADPDSRPEAEAGGVLRFFRVPGADGVGQDRAAARSEHGGKRHDDAEHRHDDGDSRYLGGIPQLGDEK